MHIRLSADRSSVLRYCTTALILAFGVAWFFTLRSETLGGPVAYVIVAGTSMEPTYHDGDLILMRRSSGYAEGDIVAFTIPAGEPGAGAHVIHRIVGRDETGYITRGDNTKGNDQWRPTADDIAGKQWLRLAGAGNFLTRLRAPLILATLAALFTVYAVLTTGRKTPPDPQGPTGSPRWRERLRRQNRPADPAGGSLLSSQVAAVVGDAGGTGPRDSPKLATCSSPNSGAVRHRTFSFPLDPRASYALAGLVAVLMACLVLTSFQAGKDPSIK